MIDHLLRPDSYNLSKNKHNCIFCKITPLQEFEYFKVIDNLKPYSPNNIMLLPKEHLHSELDFLRPIQLELIDIHTKILKKYYKLFGSCIYITRESTVKQSQWHWHRHYMSSDENINVNRIPFEPINFKI